ncbi:ABC transporter substrate-binding protein [Veillonella criceti]|uniref:Corrinoid ABC transporter substrate-binding protein n=1 Tax=Veillonella criceti TaxID=103891 RepID=A0A380NMM8_9FIRM|nr:ABC transporter substrate-binding protein [Veillonella criceti]SUP43628.1 corrinoid ABC transporter substrate-binding protein [Veillonella criceti]
MTSTWERWSRRCIGAVLSAIMIFIVWLAYTNGHWRVVGASNESVTGITLQNVDSDGNPMRFTYGEPPKRVIVTYPGATELLIDLGLSDRIVGTVAPYGEEPERYRDIYSQLPLITNSYVPSREQVLAMQPNVLMGWSHHFTPAALGDVRQWYERDIGVYIVPATIRKNQPTLESAIYPFIDDMGRLFQIPDKASAYKSELEQRVQTVTNRVNRWTYKPKVIILQAHGHSTYSLYGPVYLVDDIVKKAGGQNLTNRQISMVGPERVLAFDPDVIVYVTVSQSNRTLREAEAIAELKADPNLRNMRAIQEGRIIAVPFADVNNGNGRVVDALEKIAQGFEEEQNK